jgi:hypothetical protein
MLPYPGLGCAGFTLLVEEVGQVADAAVQSLKSLFRKKQESVKVTLKEGYRVLLSEKER